MDIKQIRHTNLLLILEKPGVSQVKLADACETSPAVISQLKTKTRNIGDSLARRIEESQKLPYGWMDSPHNTNDTEAVITPPLKPALFIADADYEVPVLDVELSAGFGSFNDSEAVLETIPVSLRILEEFGVPPEVARIVSIRGDSMEGTLRDREKVVVDTAEKRLVSNDIYAFEFDGELKVKRFIKQFDSTWTISSDNKHDPAYQDQTVSPHNIDRLRIIGRVAGLLARKF